MIPFDQDNKKTENTEEPVFDVSGVPANQIFDFSAPAAQKTEESPAVEESEPAPAPQPEPEKEDSPVEILGIRFKKGGKTYYFDPCGKKAKKGQYAIVETARGLEYGEISIENTFVSASEIVPPIRPVVRIATSEDTRHFEENQKREAESFKICLAKIAEHKLDMKLVEAQYTFDNSKLLFYFTSAGRVDFRELVKDLASVFRTRIELRQIGIRDEAKLVGGLGSCGRPLCCAGFLTDFGQVSIKMAKEQNLSLNSTKISGTCGRLMCCLRFEHETYCEEIRRTPPVDSTVKTPDGVGTVIEISPLTGLVKVRLASDQDPLPHVYSRDDVQVLTRGTTEDSSADETQNENLSASAEISADQIPPLPNANTTPRKNYRDRRELSARLESSDASSDEERTEHRSRPRPKSDFRTNKNENGQEDNGRPVRPHRRNDQKPPRTPSHNGNFKSREPRRNQQKGSS